MLVANQRDRLCGAQGSTEHTASGPHGSGSTRRAACRRWGDASVLMNLCKNFGSKRPAEKTLGSATMGVQ